MLCEMVIPSSMVSHNGLLSLQPSPRIWPRVESQHIQARPRPSKISTMPNEGLRSPRGIDQNWHADSIRNPLAYLGPMQNIPSQVKLPEQAEPFRHLLLSSSISHQSGDVLNRGNSAAGGYLCTVAATGAVRRLRGHSSARSYLAPALDAI